MDWEIGHQWDVTWNKALDALLREKPKQNRYGEVVTKENERNYQRYHCQEQDDECAGGDKVIGGDE